MSIYKFGTRLIITGVMLLIFSLIVFLLRGLKSNSTVENRITMSENVICIDKKLPESIVDLIIKVETGYFFRVLDSDDFSDCKWLISKGYYDFKYRYKLIDYFVPTNDTEESIDWDYVKKNLSAENVFTYNTSYFRLNSIYFNFRDSSNNLSNEIYELILSALENELPTPSSLKRIVIFHNPPLGERSNFNKQYSFKSRERNLIENSDLSIFTSNHSLSSRCSQREWSKYICGKEDALTPFSKFSVVFQYGASSFDYDYNDFVSTLNLYSHKGIGLIGASKSLKSEYLKIGDFILYGSSEAPPKYCNTDKEYPAGLVCRPADNIGNLIEFIYSNSPRKNSKEGRLLINISKVSNPSVDYKSNTITLPSNRTVFVSVVTFKNRVQFVDIK